MLAKYPTVQVVRLYSMGFFTSFRMTVIFSVGFFVSLRMTKIYKVGLIYGCNVTLPRSLRLPQAA